MCKCSDNPEQQREGGRAAAPLRGPTRPGDSSRFPGEAAALLPCRAAIAPLSRPPERLLKMTLEDLREFLQEKMAASLQYEDDAVIEQLQVSMTELRKMKFDLPPPGGWRVAPVSPGDQSILVAGLGAGAAQKGSVCLPPSQAGG